MHTPRLLLPIALVAAIGATATAARAGVVNGPGPRQGQIDFTVYFRFPPTPAAVADFRGRVQEASEILCDATDGELRFGRVTITGGYQHDVALEDADVWIVPYVEAGNSYATHLGFGPGHHVVLYYGNDFQSSSLAIAHELAHLALQLGDEYAHGMNGEAGGRKIGPCVGIGEPGDAITEKICLMQVAPFLDGVQQEIDESLCDELCTDLVHDLVAGDDPALPDCTADADIDGCERPGGSGENCASRCCLFNFDTCRYEGTDHNYWLAREGEPAQSCWSRIQDVFPWVGGPAPDGLPTDPAPGGCSAAVEFIEDDLAAANSVMLVLDRSYSMAFDPDAGQNCAPDCPEICDEPGETGCHDSALAFLQQSAGLYLALAQSDPSAEAGVVAFSSGSSLRAPLQPIAAGIGALEDAIDGLSAGGNTNVGGALLRARDELADASGGTRAVFLVTDGHHNVPEEEGGVDPLEAAEELLDDGIRVFLVTTGDAANDDVLGSIVDTTGGKLVETPDPRQLVSAFAQQWAHHNNVGVVIPKMPFRVDAFSSVPEPPAAIRGPDDWASGKDAPSGTPVRSNRFEFDVEEGAGAVSVIVAGTMRNMAGFAPRVILTGPGGPQPDQFDTQGDDTQAHFSILRERFFHLLRLDQPNPGRWTVEVMVLDAPGAAPEQEGTISVLVHNPRTHLLTSLDRHVVLDPSERIRLTVSPVYRSALRDPDVLEARVIRPDGTAADIPLTGGEDLELAYEGEIDDFPVAGQYQVRVRLRTGGATTRHPGEPIFSPVPQIVGGVPDLERTAVETFRVAFGPKVCPGSDGDCDGDSLPDRIDPLDRDTDGDGVPDGCDRDADGDEIPDGYDPPSDADGDDIPDHQDPDADGDGVDDSQDPSRSRGEPPYLLVYPHVDLPVDCEQGRHAPVLLSTDRPVAAIEFDILWRPTEQVDLFEVTPGADIDPDGLRSFSVEFEEISASASRATVRMTWPSGQELAPGIGIELASLALRAMPGAPVGSFAPLLSGEEGRDVLTVLTPRGGPVKVEPTTVLGRVDLVADTTPPAIQCPSVLELPADPDCCVRIEEAPAAVDDCDGEVVVRLVGGRLPLELCGVGLHGVVWTAIDSHGNQSWCVTHVQVYDSTPPEIQCPGEIVVECDGPRGASVDYRVTATDSCDSRPIVDCSRPSGSVFPVGVTTVYCHATDASGNVSACSFDVIVTCGTEGSGQAPGDCNQDGAVDIADAVCTLGFLFLGSPRELPCGDGTATHGANVRLLDWSADGSVNIADPIGELAFLFLGGPPHALAAQGRCVEIEGCPEVCRP